MAKKSTKAKPTVNKDTITQTTPEVDMVSQLAQLMTKMGARTAPIQWASILIEGAADYLGSLNGGEQVTGQELIQRTLRVKAKESAKDFPELKMHFTIYANLVRSDVIERVQKRFVPSVINVTRMAVAFIAKDPVTMEMALGFADTYAQDIITRLQNTVSSYFQQIRSFERTFAMMEEMDFYTRMEQVFRNEYEAFLKEQWSALMPIGK